MALIRFLESQTGLQAVAITVFFAITILALLFRRILLWREGPQRIEVDVPKEAAEVTEIASSSVPDAPAAQMADGEPALAFESAPTASIPASLDLASLIDSVQPEAALGGLLMAGVTIVPLVFTIASPDVFVITKLAVLRVMLFVGLFLFGLIVARASPAAGIPLSRVVDLALIAYLLFTTLATAFSIEPVTSLYGQFDQYQGLLTALLMAVFFAFARSTLASVARLRLLGIGALAGGSLVAVYAVVQQLRLDPIWNTLDKGRVFSTIGQAEWLGAYFMICLALGLPLVLCGPLRIRLPAGAALALIFVGLLLTFSRGAYLGLLVGLIVFAAGVAPLVRLSRRWLAAVPAAAVVVVLILAVPPLRDQARAVVNRAASTADFSDGSINDRFDLWRAGIAMAIDHPLLGTGPDTYPEVFPHYRDTVLAGRRAYWLVYRPESPHNVPLAIATGAGLPALAAYLAFVGAVLLAVGRVLRRKLDLTSRVTVAAVAAGIAGYFVTDLFMTADVAGTWILWLLLGAGIGLAEAFGRDERAAPTSGSS